MNSEKKYIIPLSSILQNERIAIIKLCESLKIRGFCFVELTDDLVNQIDISLKNSEIFFARDVKDKKTFFKEPIFGYSNVDHKESFRFLTGSRISEHKIPNNFAQIKNLIQTIDKIMYTIALLCSPMIFPNIIENSKKYNIPFFSMTKQWGMFDITKYHNDGKRKKINCEEHFDPGLLSMSIRSTEPGLQLKDENDKWINPPNNKKIAIIWTGDIAAKINPKIKRCIHRVINSSVPGKPRIAIWHEICTANQEHTELLNSKVDVTKLISAIQFESNSGIPISKSMGVFGDSPMFKGISMPKNMSVQKNTTKFASLSKNISIRPTGTYRPFSL